MRYHETEQAIEWLPLGGEWDVAANWSTDIVPTSGDDVLIGTVGSVVNISGLDQADQLTFNDGTEGELNENEGSLRIAGELTVDAGLLTLNEANTIGDVEIDGAGAAISAIRFGNANALGAGVVNVMDGGELIWLANETLSNELSFGEGTSTIAVGHGTTLMTRALIPSARMRS
jgi:hypothetical protein